MDVFDMSKMMSASAAIVMQVALVNVSKGMVNWFSMVELVPYCNGMRAWRLKHGSGMENGASMEFRT
ncbi:unnamed protein product [Lathyrus sativus]|nr:unnamed protein product [Lathyrus sativus]